MHTTPTPSWTNYPMELLLFSYDAYNTHSRLDKLPDGAVIVFLWCIQHPLQFGQITWWSCYCFLMMHTTSTPGWTNYLMELLLLSYDAYNIHSRLDKLPDGAATFLFFWHMRTCVYWSCGSVSVNAFMSMWMNGEENEWMMPAIAWQEICTSRLSYTYLSHAFVTHVHTLYPACVPHASRALLYVSCAISCVSCVIALCPPSLLFPHAGHWVRDCPAPTASPGYRNALANQERSCFKCGLHDHWIKDCPLLRHNLSQSEWE
jgi:hypothetical protein